MLRRSHAPLELARDHGGLCLLPRECLERAYVFLRPRLHLPNCLRHRYSPCINVATESADIVKQNRDSARLSLMPHIGAAFDVKNAVYLW